MCTYIYIYIYIYTQHGCTAGDGGREAADLAHLLQQAPGLAPCRKDIYIIFIIIMIIIIIYMYICVYIYMPIT